MGHWFLMYVFNNDDYQFYEKNLKLALRQRRNLSVEKSSPQLDLPQRGSPKKANLLIIKLKQIFFLEFYFKCLKQGNVFLSETCF
jgi:hypothetical protein